MADYDDGYHTVPASQKAAALKDAATKLAAAQKRYRSARSQEARNRAEQDLMGAEVAREKYNSWRTVQKDLS